ncbi:MAG TPA: hypothetical protein VI199_14040 [Novosphingobium sp.]
MKDRLVGPARRCRSTLALVAALLLAACQKQPTGQVLAVVGNDEITRAEVNAELRWRPRPAAEDPRQDQATALDRLVERRLLAQVAHANHVDQEQEYILRLRQLSDALLIRMLGEQLERDSPQPDQTAISRFIRNNPQLFAGRTIFTADTVSFTVRPDPQRSRLLDGDKTIAAVINRLDQWGIPFARGVQEWDSTQMSASEFTALRSAGSRPVVLHRPERTAILAVAEIRPLPVAGAQAAELARAALRRLDGEAQLAGLLAAQRLAAAPRFQPGFEPSVPAPVPAPAIRPN